MTASLKETKAAVAGADEGRVRDVEVLIVGSGFSGLIAGAQLRRSGRMGFTIIERADEVGGTWRDNTYPGAACDVPSHLYSLSFRQDFPWSRSFGHQPEIHRYQREVARKEGLYDHIEFRTEMTDASWNEEDRRWHVTTRRVDGGKPAVAGDQGSPEEGGEVVFRARELVLGVGALCEPKLPDIPGIAGFQGEMFHSARWDHDADLEGKRIAVIGTGASAIQIVPEVAKAAGKLSVFQRTPPYIMPRIDRPYAGVEKLLLKKVPGLRQIVRAQDWVLRESQVPGLTTEAEWAMKPLVWMNRAMLRTQVKDPATRAALTPDYRIGCKRMLISNKYYPAIDRDNVELVTSGIEEVGAHSIRTRDGVEHEIDVLIICTGFHVTDSPTFELVHGRDGRSLAGVWGEEGMEAYKGTVVHGFPNMTVMMGPGTGLGHSSMLQILEAQVRYFLGRLDYRDARGLDVADVTAEAQHRYNEWMRERLKPSAWVTGCSSWYIDDKGNAPAVWPSTTTRFIREHRKFDPKAYDFVAAE
ncbi:flavin-containing monooxygenase [Corynebacterium sp. 335C]